MGMRKGSRRARILAELDDIRGQINDLYWTFTRCARGKPPVLVRPELYERQALLRAELEKLARRRGARPVAPAARSR